MSQLSRIQLHAQRPRRRISLVQQAWHMICWGVGLFVGATPVTLIFGNGYKSHHRYWYIKHTHAHTHLAAYCCTRAAGDGGACGSGRLP